LLLFAMTGGMAAPQSDGTDALPAKVIEVVNLKFKDYADDGLPVRRIPCASRRMLKLARTTRTAGLIIVPFALFVLELRKAVQEVGGDPRLLLAAALPPTALLLLALASLVTTALSDPGVIARGDPEYCLDADKAPRVEHSVNGVKVTSRWCSTCKIHRPPRAKHCVFCDDCVHRFDHHCPWVANCVGLRNYRSFVTFLTSAFLLGAYVLIGSVHIFIRRANERRFTHSEPLNLHFFRTEARVFGTIIFVGIALLFLGNLLAFHIVGIAKNRTTNEEVTHPYEGNNPFDEGVLRNLAWFLRGYEEDGRWKRTAATNDDDNFSNVVDDTKPTITEEV